MAKVIVTESSLQNIGTAIRSKLGTQDTFTPSEMAGAIAQIHGDPVLETLTANANNTYTPSSGKDGFSQVVVNVPNSYTLSDEGKVVQNGALAAQSTQSISANGTYDTTLKNQVNVSVPNSYSAGDEGKVVNNGALVAQSSQTITDNGTYDTTLKNQVTVNVSGGGGGSSYPWLDATYSGTLQGYMPTVTHSATKGENFVPASSYIEQAVSSGFSYDIYTLDTGKNSLSSESISITQDKAILPVADFIKLWIHDVVAKEYKGYIYDTSKITDLGLVLLGDFSQGGSASGNVLNDSIANYTGVILQGVYKKGRTSGYNTSILYQNIILGQKYWAGMQDRNASYSCFATFIDNTHCDLSGNLQVIIYGIL